MRTAESTEACLDEANNVLVALSGVRGDSVVGDFFGSVITPEELAAGSSDLTQKTVYLCGDISGIDGHDLHAAGRVFVIRDLSRNYSDAADAPWTLIDVGRVPARVHGVGVFYRRFFEPGDDHFAQISAAHEFQSLTESTKPGTAHRSGIYLTPVTRDDDGLHFRLLRCSTNLSGPTENFRPVDTLLVEALNPEAAAVFRSQAPLNHILAQIYHNTRATAERKQSKARISAHADKTKDMPVNGVMAFCTFYDRPGELHVNELTKLYFRLKEQAGELGRVSLPAQFTVPLHPGSVFFMPLSTNRLYAHEIRPSALDAALLPTRLGYVVRCSNAEAVHKNGRTFLKTAGGDLVQLEPPTPAGMDDLRRLYAAENRTSSFIDYSDELFFSLNAGDYLAPNV